MLKIAYKNLILHFHALCFMHAFIELYEKVKKYGINTMTSLFGIRNYRSVNTLTIYICD